ncbi:hypothetical protein [Pleionea sediminis]|uniref:hypothetical protein n=1 Tax=Pleionea sediminis TaxID=2569479 RepID=UPI00118547C9|nr:hypothetical protein [Pleionea sediminis]
MRQFVKYWFCGSLISLYTSFSLATTFQSINAQVEWLGYGIESLSGVIKEPCLRGDWIRYNNDKLSLGFQNKQSVSSSIREIDGKISGDVNLGLFGGGASVQLHTRMVENSNTISVVLRINYHGSTYRLENREYSSIGQSLIGQSSQSIFSVCGDEYVDHVQLGNDIYLTSQLVFDDKEEYRKFVRKIRVRVLFFKTESTRTEEFYDYAKNARYTVKALSSNTLPPFIVEQLGGSDELHCGSDSSQSIAVCDQASDAIMSYLLRDDGYAQWLSNDDNLSVTYFESSRYGETGHQEFAVVTPENIKDWLVLSDEINTLLIHQYSLLNVFQSFAEVPVAGQAAAALSRSKIQTNIGWLRQAQDDCINAYRVKNIEACQQSFDESKEQLKAIN